MAGAILAGTFNVFAFAGAGFIFSKINRGGYESEMKRHNEAMEEFTKARDEWNQARMKEIDRVENLRYDKEQAKKDLEETNIDLDNVETKFDAVEKVKSKFDKTKPLLSNFYKPSKNMVEYINLVKYAATIPTVYALLPLYKNFKKFQILKFEILKFIIHDVRDLVFFRAQHQLVLKKIISSILRLLFLSLF